MDPFDIEAAKSKCPRAGRKVTRSAQTCAAEVSNISGTAGTVQNSSQPPHDHTPRPKEVVSEHLSVHHNKFDSATGFLIAFLATIPF